MITYRKRSKTELRTFSQPDCKAYTHNINLLLIYYLLAIYSENVPLNKPAVLSA